MTDRDRRRRETASPSPKEISVSNQYIYLIVKSAVDSVQFIRIIQNAAASLIQSQSVADYATADQSSLHVD